MNRRCFHHLLPAFALFGQSALAAPPSGAGWHLAWNDEFEDSTLDLSKWRHWLLGARRDAVNSPSAVSLADGKLNISTYTSGGTHYTGMIATQNTYQYTYGYIEARINYDSTPGMWSAFWMQSDSMGNPIGSPNSAGTEIDICEHRKVDGSGVNREGNIGGVIHWDGYGTAHRSIGYDSGNLGLGNGFHIYGMEWTPTQQKFYINGVLRWTVNNNATNSPVSHRNEFIILSSEVSDGGWSSAVPTSGYGTLATTTTRMEVDYVRVYRRAETVVNGDLEGKTSPFSRVNQAYWSSTGGRSDPASARLAPTSSAGASIQQSLFGILPDTGYTLTAWGNAGSTAASLTIGANNFGGTQVSQTLTSSSYTQATVPFATGPTHRSASVFAKSNNSGSTAYVDDFLVRRHATVNNGQVESGTHDAWNSTYGGSTISTESTYDGTFAWKIPASGSSAGVEQEIVGLTPSTAYRLSGWTTNGNSGLTFGVKNHGASQVATTIAANTWTRATVNFTTGPSSNSATAFAFRSSSTQTAYADAFFLYQPLAAPWTSADISTTGLDGTAGRLAGKFTLQASGANLGGNADRMHFLYQSLTGDATITARILGVDATAYHAKTGVMIRESTAPDARSVSLTWGPVNQQLEFIRRSSTASSASITSTPREITTPPWVRLTRRGSTFTAYRSPDGLAWTRVGSPQIITMPSSILIGIPACSGDTSRLTEALLDNLTITAPVPDVVITSPAEGATLTNNGQSLRITATIDSSNTSAIAWSKVSGPGTVTFENSILADTSATFSAPGTYVLRCSATTEAGTGSADLTLNIAPSTTADPSLVFSLSLDESTGTTAFDSSGNNHHGTTQGALTWQPTSGAVNGTAAFNGTDTHIAVSDSNLLDPTTAFTLAYWFKANTITNNTGLIAKRVTFNDQNAYGIFLTIDGKLNIDIDSNNNRFTSATTFNSGAWYHVALVFDGSLATAQRAKLYVNGSLDTAAAETSGSIANSSAPIHIGALTAASSERFDGLIDEIRFHRRALTPSEISALKNETGTPAPEVSAGPAPVTLVNTPAFLSGSVSARSGPPPAALWTKISGPGNVVFADPDSPNTSVSFDQAGEYVLRLTATNAYGQTFAELSDTIFEAALPAPEIAITQPTGPVYLADTTHILHLATSVETAHVPGMPAYAWTQTSGPGATIFADPTAADTTATFSAPGTYVLRCTVTNAGGSDTVETTIAIASPITTTLRQIENEYTHAATFIRGDTPSWNSGARDLMLVGRNDTAAKLFRGVLSFPLTGIPSNATLTHISLDLWTHDSQAGTGSIATLELRELTDTPVEGTGSGSTATDGAGTGATWNNRTQTSAWNIPGGDFSSTVLSSISGFNATTLGVPKNLPSSAAFLNAAQNAIASASPLDLMLRSPSTESGSTANFTRLASDDHPDPALRPRLTLTWTASPAPVIIPGPAPAATAGEPANLTGSASGATSTTWSPVSGPGTATFGNPDLATTTVSFDEPGEYILRLTAANNSAQVSRLLTIQVAAPPLDPSHFGDWQQLTWPGLSDPEITDPTADPDLDGHNNLLEWALHLDPTTPDRVPLSAEKVGNSLEFTYTRRKTTGASFVVEWSDTLGGDWSNDDVISEMPVTLTLTPTSESILSTIPATSDRRFVRLRVQTD